MAVEVIGSITVGLAAGSFALLALGSISIVELLSGVVILRHLRKDPGAQGRATGELFW